MVSESLSNGLYRINEWCIHNGKVLYPSKTKSKVFSRSRTLHPTFPVLEIGNCIIEDVDDVAILSVSFDKKKLTFEDYLRRVAVSASQNIGILRRA